MNVLYESHIIIVLFKDASQKVKDMVLAELCVNIEHLEN